MNELTEHQRKVLQVLDSADEKRLQRTALSRALQPLGVVENDRVNAVNALYDMGCIRIERLYRRKRGQHPKVVILTETGSEALHAAAAQ